MAVGLKIEGVSFDVDALKARPEHAAVLGRVFTSWSLIEGTIAGLLGLMMHADERAALAILQTFRTNNARVDAVRKVGAEMLSEEHKADFDSLMKAVTKYATERNAIAHNLWGMAESEPDLVYRLPMSAISGLVVRAPTMTPDQIDAWVSPIKAQMKSFTLADLEQLEQQGQQVLHRVMSETTGKMFRLAVAAKSSGVA
jgi:hypothetical protein